MSQDAKGSESAPTAHPPLPLREGDFRYRWAHEIKAIQQDYLELLGKQALTQQDLERMISATRKLVEETSPLIVRFVQQEIESVKKVSAATGGHIETRLEALKTQEEQLESKRQALSVEATAMQKEKAEFALEKLALINQVERVKRFESLGFMARLFWRG